ncbi:hypothetical protein Acr_19g0010910 [Actinidia rufa]|uniref:Uncharacterized protein n=1 Tax=Actinidia rufa TaxID=165716 RepID=A0A7J0GBI1_9ERIC|nr:hypothetical protein Acr_19g0010910 [Actinidia rufa]
MKLATKSRLRSPKESMVPGDSFRNHDLAGPFKVAENALHITSSEQPWSDIRLFGEIARPQGRVVQLEMGVLAAARSCIRRPLFSFIILICSAISCISRWRSSRSGAWAGLAIGWDLFPGGLLALGLGRLRLRRCIEVRELSFPQTAPNCCGKKLGRATNSQYCSVSSALDLGCLKGDLHRRTKVNGRGEAAQNPSGVEIRPRILVEIDQAKYSTSPKGEEETTLWLWASSVEIAWRGSMLNVGLVLPRSRGFGDKVWRSKCGDGT